MSSVTSGLHHVTGIATSPQGNIEFYVRVLGLRLVKRTVNYDDPETYHFYFGDPLGRPGSIVSFFPWPGAGPAVRGSAEPSRVTFAAPPGALALWSDRFNQHGVKHSPVERFGRAALEFTDPDGTPLAVTEAPLRGTVPDNWPGSPIDAEMALQGLHSATVQVPDVDRTAELLTALGLETVAEEATRGGQQSVRLSAKEAATHLEIEASTAEFAGRHGAGTLHHVALRVKNDEALKEAREQLLEAGAAPTKVKNRTYFKSVYFREPGGAIFELATDGPGFTVDESADELGLAFRLPEWLEAERDFLRGRLPVTASPEYSDRFGRP